MTIRYKLLVSGIAAVILPFLLAGIFSYISLSRSLEQISKEKSMQIALDLAYLMQVSLSRESSLVSAVSKNPQIIGAAASDNYANIDALIKYIYQNSGALYGSLFIIDRKGIIRADSMNPRHKGVNVSDREYFLQTKAGKTYVSNPIISRVDAEQSFFMVFSAPLAGKNGNYYGTVAFGQDIKFMARITSLKIGKTGYVFIVDSTGRLIAQPNQDYNINIKLQNMPGMESISKKILGGQTGSENYIHKGVENIAGFAPVNLTGWTVVVTQDRDEILAPAISTFKYIALSGLIVFIITISGIVLLSHKIGTPIQKTVNIMKEITEHLAEVVINIGPNKKIESVNPAAEKFLKCPAADIIGTKPVLNNLNNIPEEFIWQKLDKRQAWAGRVVFSENVSDAKILEVLIMPIHDSKGIIYNYLEIGKDITNELTNEKRLIQAQKMEAIGTLAGGIAHDFNNVLSGIVGYAELALYAQNDKTKSKEYIQEVLKASQRARDLVNQILTFSRHTQVELKQINPKFIIKEILKFLRASLPATIELNVSINSDSVILAEPTQLHQVVINLVTNAAQAMKDNKGMIEVELKDIEINEKYAELHPGIHPGKHILLRVSDTGCGIKSEYLDHIFEPFFTTKSAGKGTGLGLSVVHGIIKRLNGIITVYSEMDKGSTFNIIIPITTPEQIINISQQSAEPPGGSEKIMLIDDEQSIVDSIQIILTNLGYKVFPYNDSISALDAFQKDPRGYELVITDYTMPNKTGIEIAEKIKGIRKDVPVILCSGFVYKDMEEAARKAGINEILRKPINTFELATAIRRLFALK